MLLGKKLKNLKATKQKPYNVKFYILIWLRSVYPKVNDKRVSTLTISFEYLEYNEKSIKHSFFYKSLLTFGSS